MAQYDEKTRKAVAAAFRRNLASHTIKRRHPAEVTSDRLGDAASAYDFTAEERDAIALIRYALGQIAENER